MSEATGSHWAGGRAADTDELASAGRRLDVHDLICICHRRARPPSADNWRPSELNALVKQRQQREQTTTTTTASQTQHWRLLRLDLFVCNFGWPLATTPPQMRIVFPTGQTAARVFVCYIIRANISSRQREREPIWRDRPNKLTAQRPKATTTTSRLAVGRRRRRHSPRARSAVGGRELDGAARACDNNNALI